MNLHKLLGSNIVFIIMAYITLLNVCIGLYVGLFGANGFKKLRPIALLIQVFGLLGVLLIFYAQNEFGFKAQPSHLAISFAFFIIALLAGYRIRLSKSSEVHHEPVEIRQVDPSKAQEEQAGLLWRQENYSDARCLYEDVLLETALPLDKVKILANIAQLYEKEGLGEQAVSIAEEAIDVINRNELFESLEGSHLRGFLNGFLNRLKKEELWAPPGYSGTIPLEMNLSEPNRLFLHFSLAVIAGGLTGTLLNSIWPNGSGIAYVMAGMIFGELATSRLFEQAVISYSTFTNKPIQACLEPAVDILTEIAVVYLFLMPFILKDLMLEVGWFIVSGSIGVAFFRMFVLSNMGRAIDVPGERLSRARILKNIITSAALGGFIGFIALLIAGYVLLPKGTSLTYKETYKGQSNAVFPSQVTTRLENQEYVEARVVDISLSPDEGGRTVVTSKNYFPGLLAHIEDFSNRFRYSLVLGGIMGALAGVAIGFLTKSSSSKFIGFGGLAAGVFFEYHIESLFTIVLNSHSMDLPLLSFQVVSNLPMQIIYNVESFFIVQILKPLDVYGFYLVLLAPMFVAILAILGGRFGSENTKVQA